MTGRESDPIVTATRWLVGQGQIGVVLLDGNGIVSGSHGDLVDWIAAGEPSSDCLPFLAEHEEALAAVSRRQREALFLPGIRHPRDAGDGARMISVRCIPTEGAPGTTLIFEDVSAIAPSNGSVERQRDELALAERRMAQAQESAKVANQARSLFLANVSHELRTPLNVIIGNAEILRDWDPGTFSTQDLHTFADDILDNGTFLLDHINDLLDLARAEVGGIDLEEEEVDIGLVVDGAVSAARKVPHAGTLTIQHRPAANLPLLMGDPQRLRQILLNLLVDAVRIAPSGGSVLVRSFVADDDALTIEIVDDGGRSGETGAGDGIQPLGKDSSTSDNRARSDSALGLPLAKTLIELHDGSLIQEDVSDGTKRLTLRFPPKRTRAVA